MGLDRISLQTEGTINDSSVHNKKFGIKNDKKLASCIVMFTCTYTICMHMKGLCNIHVFVTVIGFDWYFVAYIYFVNTFRCT